MLQVNFINDMIKMQVSLKVDCVNILASIHGLLSSLLSLDTVRKDKYARLSLEEVDSEQVYLIFLIKFVVRDY